jgi:hypothetical protein
VASSSSISQTSAVDIIQTWRETEIIYLDSLVLDDDLQGSCPFNYIF